MTEEERLARKITARAVRRLEVVSWALTLAAAAMATVAGAVAAYLLRGLVDFPFRSTWIVCSLAFFILPAAAVAIREIRERRPRPHDDTPGNGN